MSKKPYNVSKGVKNLREVRKIAGLTQLELATLAQVAHVSIRAIETGNQKYSFDLVERLARLLGCDFTRGDREQPPGLLLTCIGSDVPYTREWFDQWCKIRELRQVYSRFFSICKNLMSDSLDAACEVDFEIDKTGRSFEHADAIAKKLVHVIGDLLSDEAIARQMPSVLRRGETYPDKLSSPDARVSDYVEVLRRQLDDRKDLYIRKLDRSSSSEEC